MQRKYRDADEHISDGIRDALEEGMLEETPDGKYRVTRKGEIGAQHMLATERSARAFYREMNRLYGLPSEHGLPEWQGEGDEF